MKKIDLGEFEYVETAWCESCFGSGSRDGPACAIIYDSATGKRRIVGLPSHQQSADLRTMHRIAATVHAEVLALVRAQTRKSKGGAK